MIPENGPAGAIFFCLFMKRILLLDAVDSSAPVGLLAARLAPYGVCRYNEKRNARRLRGL